MYNNMQAKIYPNTLTLDPWGGVKVQTNCFSECGHVAYQIKGNEMQNKMHAKHYLTVTLVLTFLDGLKNK